MRDILIAAGMVATLFSGAVASQSAVKPQAPASAQPPPQPQQNLGAPTPAPPVVLPPPAETYTYEAQGRRDPFVTVIGTGMEVKSASRKGSGPAGTLSTDIVVRGVILSGATHIALVQGPDKRTYVMRAGDKLLDGTVKTVSSDGMTIVQDVNDPLSLVKTREVRKPLRSKEDANP